MAEAKTLWYMPKRDIPLWRFDNRPTPSLNDKIVDDELAQYDDIQSQILELAYTNNQSKAKLDDYTIDLKNMIQYNNIDTQKQRRVYRQKMNESSVNTSDKKSKSRHYYRSNIATDENRFVAPPKLVKSLGEWELSQFPIVEEWIKRNPHYKFKSEDTVEQIANGIEKEGSLVHPPKTIEAKYVADELRKVKDKPLHEIMCYCVVLYTYESFIFQLVNKALREKDAEDENAKIEFAKKVDTLGPYCCMLRDFLHGDRKTIYKTVYRAVKLNSVQIDEYKNSIGEIKTWSAFSSTSNKPEIVEKFGNTLFVIQFKDDTSPCYPGRAIKSYSMYTDEEEILLYPGIDFRIDKVEETGSKPLEYKIYLALM